MLAARHQIAYEGKTVDELVASILQGQGIETSMPAPSAPVAVVRDAAAPAPRVPIGKYSCLMGPGEKPEAVSSGAPATPPSAIPVKKLAVAVVAQVPVGRYACLMGPGEVPEAVSSTPAPVVPLPAPKVEAKPVSPKVGVALQRRLAVLKAPGEQPATETVPPAVPAVKAPVKPSPPAPSSAAEKLGRYSFLLGPGEVPEKTSP
jgi:hypothetical protein